MIIPDWAKELNCSITVCDKDGVIIYQNDPSVRQYEKHGVHKFIFQSAWKEDGEVNANLGFAAWFYEPKVRR